LVPGTTSAAAAMRKKNTKKGPEFPAFMQLLGLFDELRLVAGDCHRRSQAPYLLVYAFSGNPDNSAFLPSFCFF
jgi:hypothetical protein